MGRSEADDYKFDTVILTFVEQLFSPLTLQTYPCNNENISETRKEH